MTYYRELQNTEEVTLKPDSVVREDFPEKGPSMLGPEG